MKKDYVKVNIGGRKLRWYYKDFAKRVITFLVMSAILAGMTMGVVLIMFRQADQEHDSRMQRQERHIEQENMIRTEQGDAPLSPVQ